MQYWNQLSKCQRSLIYSGAVISFLTIYYLYSFEKENTFIMQYSNENENRKDILKNIRNDPRDAIEPDLSEFGHEHQVLEEPAGAEIDNNINGNQVLLPPKVEHRFTGNNFKFIELIEVTL